MDDSKAGTIDSETFFSVLKLNKIKLGEEDVSILKEKA